MVLPAGTTRPVEDAGKVYSYTIADLQEGTTFYIAATAYDRYGNESDFSEEVVYLAPVSNHAPVAQSGTLSTNQDTAATGTLTATDPDGGSLTYTIVTQGAKGAVTITGATTGAYQYTPVPGHGAATRSPSRLLTRVA